MLKRWVKIEAGGDENRIINFKWPYLEHITHTPLLLRINIPTMDSIYVCISTIFGCCCPWSHLYKQKWSVTADLWNVRILRIPLGFSVRA